MEKGRIVHYRKSIQLKGYNYSQTGAYFITICAWKRECFFGDVINGEMELKSVYYKASRNSEGVE